MARITTDYTFQDRVLSYEVAEDGYDIYLGSNKWIVQHEPFIPNMDLSYEENAIAQIKEIAEANQ